MIPLLNEFKEKLLQEYKNTANMTNTISVCFKFEEWFGSDQMDKVSSKDIEQFKTYLTTEHITYKGTGLSNSTIIFRLLALKKYFIFLLENNKINMDPMLDIEIPKKRTHLPPYLPTEKEIEELIGKVDISSPEGIRDRAVIALMSIFPLKNKELIQLTVDQIDLKNRCIYPKKETKGLSMPMGKQAFQALDMYLNIGRPDIVKWAKKPTDLLFVSRWGKPFSRGTLVMIFKKYSGYTGERRIYPYLMRQATANNMRRNGAKLADIQAILGIKLGTARVYTTLARNEIRAEQERWVAKIPLFKEFKEKLIKDELYPNIINKILKSVIFFAKYLKSENMKNIRSSDIERCKNYILNEYISHEGRKLREQDATARIHNLKAYFRFLTECGYLSSDPAASVEIPRPIPRIRWYCPTEEDIEEFAARPDQYSYVGIRDAAMIRLWHLAPLKSHEQKNLKIHDVDLEKKMLYWREQKRCGLKLDEKTHKTLERYLKVSRPVFLKKAKAPTDKLFLNEWGDPFVECSIFEIFWKYRGDKKIKPYATRHIMALDMLRNGATLEEVKDALGVKSIRMCEAYEAVIASDINGFYKRDRFENKVNLLKRVPSIQ